MTNSIKKIAVCSLITGGVFFWGCNNNNPKPTLPPFALNQLPQDAFASCPITESQLSTWFVKGKIEKNGIVAAANSVNLVHNNNCQFYQWAEQMFLWITSPVGGRTVMESPTFYTVQPDTTGTQTTRTLIQNGNGPIRAFANIKKFGPNRLPVVKATTKKNFELEAVDIASGEKNMVLDNSNNMVEVASIEKTADGKHILKDAKGAVIANPKPIIKHTTNTNNIAKVITINNVSIALAKEGEIQTEEGQAGGSFALMAQTGSLVYYISMVNDFYAYYLTGVKSPADSLKYNLNGNQFPADTTSMHNVCAFARSRNVTLADSNALAMELKTSWVEASTLPDASGYLTIMASVPIYTKTDTTWIPSGKNQVVKLAMIGMHIAGTVSNHPEMVWATFEHQSNTPNASYPYLNTKGATVIWPADTGSNWLLNNVGAGASPANIAYMACGYSTGSAEYPSYNGGDTIHNVAPATKISASNTLRTKPFGVSIDSIPNQEDTSASASNSEVISLNNSIKNLMPKGDIRANYLFLGATWTNGGAAPNGQSYSNNNTIPGVAIGTGQLANSTMETYHQNGVTYNLYGSCLSCHSTLNPNNLSHVFSTITPLLPSAPKEVKK